MIDLVSVIVPAYNAGQHLEDCLHSILRQDYEGSVELLIINDGSTDNTLEIARRFRSRHQSAEFVIRIYSQTNQGVSSARNKGIQHANGDLVAFLDSDDSWYPIKLRMQIRCMQDNPHIDALGSNRNGEKYTFFGKLKLSYYSLNTFQLIFKWYPHTSTLLIKKTLLDSIGFYNNSMSHAEDGEFLVRLSGITRLWVLNEDLVLTGRGKRAFGVSGLSANLLKMLRGELIALKHARNQELVSPNQYWFLLSWLLVKYIRRFFVAAVSNIQRPKPIK